MRKLLKSLLIRLNAFIYHDTTPKVVFYHDIGKKYTKMGTVEELFWKHMEILNKSNKKNDIGHKICFDDGFHGIWDQRDTLRKIGVIPTVFLAIDLIDKAGYLTWDEISVLQKDYGFDFQCHTWSHQTLCGPGNSDLGIDDRSICRDEKFYKKELIDSKLEIENHLEKNVDSLCFPVGYFSSDVISRALQAGYKKLYASYPGKSMDKHVVTRILAQDLSVADFRAALNGGMNRLGQRYRLMHYKGN